ncbi:Golgi integral membrane protein 4 [Dufourea novaeangliae]|uniref:Golgi integral membrane protein 4 n=1 Tax=Dufourea novaeangliae TaxID=178035 RepID=A0A154PAC2_DUFNO|nr:Golgi integral membrane protein 4 [Dufourea novaeangliae]
MSGSRLGRGRGGRLAVYGGCGVVVVLLVILYRAATSEMARLRELHVQCAHQQEALAAQLQVIFEYKVRLEKSLAEEKSSNVAVKQELQQRASREKSLRDKDGREAMQRFESLQQTYKILQSEHQDLQEECKKHESQALEDMNKLEGTLQELRIHMNHLKNKYLEVETDKGRIEDKYKDLLKNHGNTNSTIEHLKKEVFQLTRELEEARKLSKSTSPGPSIASPRTSQKTGQDMKSADAGNAGQPNRPSPLQQSTAASSSMKSIPAMRLETSTSASNPNPASTAADKSLPAAKQALKAKLPMGVPPIPVMIDLRQENRKEKLDEDATRKKIDPKKKDTGSQEHEVENENLDPGFPERKNDGQMSDRRGSPDVGPGVQEFGDELNNLPLPGLNDGDRILDEHYDVADDAKELQQKNSDTNLNEDEDEAEGDWILQEYFY